MSHIAFVVRGTPKTQGSMKTFVPKGWNRAIVTHDNPATREWRTLVALEARSVAPSEPWAGPIGMRLTFFVQRPKGHTKPNGELRKSAPLYPDKKPDTSKLVRAVEDALSGVIYADDAQIVELQAEKRYGAPGVEVEVRQL